MDINEKKLYCEIVAQLLIIDGAITDDERAFLDQVFGRLGLDADERRDVIHHVNVDDDIEAKVQRLAPDVRAALSAELEAAAGADHEILGSERDIIARVRATLAGFG
ncbi:MAG: hypothetical protein KC420_03060 [Myxococcales bacterium]|nr:hypothetical protein [Myxococcales bacterium]